MPGKLIGSPPRARAARKPKHCASSASPSQPSVSTGSTGTPSRVAQRRHDRRIAPPAAGHQPASRRRRQRRGGDGGGGERDQRRGAVGRRQVLKPAGGERRGEIQPVQRFRRRPRRNTDAPAVGPARPSSTRPDRASAPSRSNALPVCRADPVVQRPVARTGVERDQRPVRADPGDVRHAADVQHRQRLRHIARQRGVIDRRQRRALAARRDVGRAEIVARPACRSAAPAGRHRRSARSGADRADAGSSGRGSRSGPPSRPSAATARTWYSVSRASALFRRRSSGASVGARSRIRRRSRAQPIIVGQGQRRTERADPLAVGLQPGSIDAVQRRAAHQSDRAQHFPARRVLAVRC